ncbi:hypothetical protein LQ327_08820 [Actinomycetospora endophytica]|uniref:Uncharacterized protein n=1 Tax=Actinomycetospora endophytica TaxID=2291215 RepID=A0ABS8P638_9PSEU|nr:hypothetical protein [Actinomycetospora endophytica]MCD2193483.1 hypothetical protein [Actinomycetospora endophytica]
MQTTKVDGRKTRRRAVHKLLDFGHQNPGPHTIHDLATGIEMTERSVKYGIRELKTDNRISADIWWTQEGKRALWTFHL